MRPGYSAAEIWSVLLLDKLVIETPKHIPTNDPLAKARQSVIAYLEQQWALAEKAVKGEVVETGRRGYFARADGRQVLRVRVGAQVMSFGEGRTDVVCKDHKDVLKSSGILINAARNGDLDEFIKQTIDARKERVNGMLNLTRVTLLPATWN